MINDDSHPKTFGLNKPYMPIFFLLKAFLKIFTFEKNLNFSEKMPSEGLL